MILTFATSNNFALLKFRFSFIMVLNNIFLDQIKLNLGFIIF